MGLHRINRYETCKALKSREPMKLLKNWCPKLTIGDALKTFTGYYFRVKVVIKAEGFSPLYSMH